MTAHVERNGLKVAAPLAELVENEVLTGGVTADAFWSGYAALLGDLMPQNKALLEVRDRMQGQIDDWHRARRGQPHDPAVYRAFLQDIGYVAPAPAPFTVGT
ncbi:MAG TPA: malate synthase G, partial [Paracoccus sp. (in: a-proteobacteria)]|nr:malate synthase G [Paracoccus sp. (in: a-proteobacteria)]